MTDVTPALLDGEDLLTTEVSEVHSPYDGSLVGIVPAATTADLDTAIAVALERHRSGPPPAHERAAILDRAAVLLGERLDEFAESITRESAKPITTARTEAERAVDTIRFSAAVARTLTGEIIPGYSQHAEPPMRPSAATNPTVIKPEAGLPVTLPAESTGLTLGAAKGI